jgi:exosome complex RNA-binding protein Csl4
MSRRAREGELVLPGASLGPPPSAAAAAENGDDDDNSGAIGIGTRVDSATNQLRASVLGTVASSSVTAVTPLAAAATKLRAPRPGSTVLFRVTKVQNIGAGGTIVAIDGAWCAPNFRGFVRLEDIRSVTAKEAAAGNAPTHAAESYRLGDLVCADVISLTEARQFQLTTQPLHCGVVKVFSVRPTDGKYTKIENSSGGVKGAAAASSLAYRRDRISVMDEDGATVVIARWVPGS